MKNPYSPTATNKTEQRKCQAELLAADVGWSQQWQKIKKSQIATMGVQSQTQNGTIKHCMKRATKAKGCQYLQLLVDPQENQAFDPNWNCVVCKAVFNNKPKRHKPHHMKCPKKNNKVKKISKTTML